MQHAGQKVNLKLSRLCDAFGLNGPQQVWLSIAGIKKESQCQSQCRLPSVAALDPQSL